MEREGGERPTLIIRPSSMSSITSVMDTGVMNSGVMNSGVMDTAVGRNSSQHKLTKANNSVDVLENIVWIISHLVISFLSLINNMAFGLNDYVLIGIHRGLLLNKQFTNQLKKTSNNCTILFQIQIPHGLH